PKRDPQEGEPSPQHEDNQSWPAKLSAESISQHGRIIEFANECTRKISEGRSDRDFLQTVHASESSKTAAAALVARALPRVGRVQESVAISEVVLSYIEHDPYFSFGSQPRYSMWQALIPLFEVAALSNDEEFLARCKECALTVGQFETDP